MSYDHKHYWTNGPEWTHTWCLARCGPWSILVLPQKTGSIPSTQFTVTTPLTSSIKDQYCCCTELYINWHVFCGA